MVEIVKDRSLVDKDLELIKASIDTMSKLQHVEILKILKSNKNVKLNENRNGVYINLSFLPENCIEEMRKYISYIEDQEQTLLIAEQKKIELSYQVT